MLQKNIYSLFAINQNGFKHLASAQDYLRWANSFFTLSR